MFKIYKLKKYFYKEYIFSTIFVLISTSIGMIYAVYGNKGSEIQVKDFANCNFIEVFMQLFTHNILIACIILFLSIFFFIGQCIPVGATYFLFGDGFINITKTYGFDIAIKTYPHIIFETIAIIIALGLSFKISIYILQVVIKNKPFEKKELKFKFILNILICLICFFIAGIIEAIKITYFKGW